MRQSSGSSVRAAPVLLTVRQLAIAWFVLAMVFGVLVARGGSDPMSWRRWVLITLLGALMLLIVASVVMQLAGVDAEATEIASGLTADHDQRRLLERWLERARWARFVGGLCGLVAWALGTRMQGDVLLLGAAGIALGALGAEAHHLRRPRGPRTADLTVRTMSAYLDRPAAIGMIATAAGAVAVSIVAILARSRLALMLGCGVLGVLVIGVAAQYRIMGRSRPAVAARLRRADDLTRRLAITRGIALPCTYLALAMLSHACRSLAHESNLEWFGLVGIALWLFALGLWWRNRRLGLTAAMFSDVGAVEVAT